MRRANLILLFLGALIEAAVVPSALKLLGAFVWIVLTVLAAAASVDALFGNPRSWTRR